MPPRPARRPLPCRNFRATRWFSGTRPRAKLRAPPATWVWTSTPPGNTSMPRASMVRAAFAPDVSAPEPPSAGATIRPLSMQMSLTTPLTPLAGSYTFPPVIRSTEGVSARSSADSHGHVGWRLPRGFGRHREPDATNDVLVGWIRRRQRRTERQRDFVHAIHRAGRADAGWSGGDVHPGEAAGVRHLGIEHDGRNAREVIDRRLRHGGAGVGAEDQRRVVVAADQQVDGRELPGIEHRKTARQADPERVTSGVATHGVRHRRVA